jgi:hypothetical protein
MKMNRYKASAAHFAISVFIAVLVFAAMSTLWYPGVFFDAAGGRVLFLLIAGVDVTLGPLITLIVYVPGKRGLRFDLTFIAVAQVCALAYGVWVVFESRPAYFVFVKDRFELVRANDIPDENLEKPAAKPYAALPATGPVVVGVRMPTEPAEAFRIAVSGLAGVDVQAYPEYYVPYDSVRAQVREKAAPIERLRTLNPNAGAEIDGMLARTGRPEAEVGFLPFRAGKRDLTVLVDRRTGDVIHYSALRPWEY